MTIVFIMLKNHDLNIETYHFQMYSYALQTTPRWTIFQCLMLSAIVFLFDIEIGYVCFQAVHLFPGELTAVLMDVCPLLQFLITYFNACSN